jgi:hypothetical protein
MKISPKFDYLHMFKEPLNQGLSQLWAANAVFVTAVCAREPSMGLRLLRDSEFFVQTSNIDPRLTMLSSNLPSEVDFLKSLEFFVLGYAP